MTLFLFKSGRTLFSAAWALPLISSVLLWASFFPLNLSSLAWVCLIPITLLVRTEQRPRNTVRWSYLWGFVGSVITLQWMRLGHTSMYLALLALSAYLACYFPAFVLLTRLAVHRFQAPLVLAVPIVWTGLEFARSHVLTGFSWYYLGHSQYRWIELIQISDLVGAYGVSFVVAMTNASLTMLVPGAVIRRLQLPFDGSNVQRHYLVLALTVLTLVGVVAYGTLRRSQANFSKGPRVALIQGNFTPQVKHDPNKASDLFRMHDRLTYLAMRDARVNGSTLDLVVWPETMFPWPVYDVDEGVTDRELTALKPNDSRIPDEEWIDIYRSRDTLERIERDARKYGAAMLIGVPYIRGTKTHEEQRNSVFFVTPQHGYQGRYDKTHLVIFGEYVPLKKYAPVLSRFSPFGSGFGITPGAKASVFKYAATTFSPIICYEDTVPHLVREISRSAIESGKPVDFFINQSNDGWFAGSSEQEQHLVTALFRCVETRTPMVRAVNTGVSAFIDGNGVILDPDVVLDASNTHRNFRDASGNLTKQFAGLFIDNVMLDSRKSVYVDIGDVFAGTCAVICLFLLGASFLRWRKQRI